MRLDGIHISFNGNDNSVDRSLNSSAQALRGPPVRGFVMRDDLDDFTRIAILRMVLSQNYPLENDPNVRVFGGNRMSEQHVERMCNKICSKET